MKIKVRDNAEGGLVATSEIPDQNLWIEVVRDDSVEVYVGSLYFTEEPDGSLTVEWGTARPNWGNWTETAKVVVPAHELNKERSQKS